MPRLAVGSFEYAFNLLRTKTPENFLDHCVLNALTIAEEELLSEELPPVDNLSELCLIIDEVLNIPNLTLFRLIAVHVYCCTVLEAGDRDIWVPTLSAHFDPAFDKLGGWSALDEYGFGFGLALYYVSKYLGAIKSVELGF